MNTYAQLTEKPRDQGLQTPVQFVKGVGPNRAVMLEKMGIRTVYELLHYFPFRYEGWDSVIPISDICHNERATVAGHVERARIRKTRSGRQDLVVTFSDESGAVNAIWFNQPHLKERFALGGRFIVQGDAEFYKQLQLKNPRFERIDDDQPPKTSQLLPVYVLTDGLYPATFRRIMQNALARYACLVEDPMDRGILTKRTLIPLSSAIRKIHFPQSDHERSEALRRLSYDDFFFMEFALSIRRRERRIIPHGIAFKITDKIKEHIRRRFPFDFTNAQARVIQEIFEDMSDSKPTNRLIQGDVGCGKTAVALAAMLAAVANGYQAALMAPTEILAEQHYRNLLARLQDSRVEIVLLVSGLARKKREKTLADCKSGKTGIMVGTHALIQKDVAFASLGMVVVDEQHKFGVLQRSLLVRQDPLPDVLVMTATPIPRTLALTLFGDLDTSVIDELPPGRQTITTRWVKESHREKTYEFVRAQLDAGRQAYVVCPLVEESDKLDLKAATEMSHSLALGPFQNYRVDLIHGKMASEQKQAVMQRFKQGEVQVLVSTVVVEVGMDVPNASVMIVEHADRFGLAQLHQLRGRVGRSTFASYCFIFGEPVTDNGKKRLHLFESIHDGFKLAEEDLRLRGPGEFFGTRQHGLPEIRVGNPIEDYLLLEKARKDAFSWIEEHPGFDYKGQSPLAIALRERFVHGLALIDVG